MSPYFDISISDAVAMLWSMHGAEIKLKELLEAVEDPLINIGHLKLKGKVVSVTWEDVAAHFVKEANSV